MKRSTHPRARRVRSSQRRGFTLVELIVAMGAALLIALAAMVLSRNATRFFQHEARISSAQLAASLGMRRLTSDLQRAAFLGTRNNSPGGGLDAKICNVGVVLPNVIANLTGLRIKLNGSVIDHPGELAQSVAPENGLSPDSVVIAGSFHTTEMFTSDDINQTGGAWRVRLMVSKDEAMGRLREATSSVTEFESTLKKKIFTKNSILRIVRNDRYMYGLVDSVSNVQGVAPDDFVDVLLTGDPQLPNQNSNGICGVHGTGHSYLVSVLSRVRYDVRSVLNSPDAGVKERFKWLVAPDDPGADLISGTSGRTELVRVELDQADQTGVKEDPDTLEIVSEFAVDLKFGVTKAPPSGSPNALNPTMTTYPFDDPEVELTPELVRAVQVRLATRSRAPDRDSPLVVNGRPMYFAIPSNQSTTRFARMRVLHSYVNLPSQQGFSP